MVLRVKEKTEEGFEIMSEFERDNGVVYLCHDRNGNEHYRDAVTGKFISNEEAIRRAY